MGKALVSRRTAEQRNPQGRFVVQRGNDMGFAWCDRVGEVSARLIYTDLPRIAVDTRFAPIEDVEARRLPKQMRVWFQNRFFGWWPGRILGYHPTGDYLVELAGSVAAFWIPGNSLSE